MNPLIRNISKSGEGNYCPLYREITTIVIRTIRRNDQTIHVSQVDWFLTIFHGFHRVFCYEENSLRYRDRLLPLLFREISDSVGDCQEIHRETFVARYYPRGDEENYYYTTSSFARASFFLRESRDARTRMINFPSLELSTRGQVFHCGWRIM